jgi:hypothetical protein
MTLTSSLLLSALLTAAPNAPAPARSADGSPDIASVGAAASAIERPIAPRGLAAERWPGAPGSGRPAALPALYASLGVLQALDVYSTRRAVGAGAGEANPLMQPAAGHAGAMLAVKAVSTAASIYFAERAWKKNRKGAIVLMAALNGVTAAVVAHNLRPARR